MVVQGIVTRTHHMMQLFHKQESNFGRKVQLLLVKLGCRRNHVNKVLQNIGNMQRNLKRNIKCEEKFNGTILQYF
jgi:hypothetical protein